MNYGTNVTNKQQNISEVSVNVPSSMVQIESSSKTTEFDKSEEMRPSSSDALHAAGVESLRQNVESGQVKVVFKPETSSPANILESMALATKTSIQQTEYEYAVPDIITNTNMDNNAVINSYRQSLIHFYTSLNSSLPLYNRACEVSGRCIQLEKCWVDLQFQTALGQRSTDHIEVIRSALEQRLPVVFSGVAGAGKSTLLKKIALDWAKGLLPEFDLVLVARLREIPNKWSSLLSVACSYINNHIPFSKPNIEGIIEEGIKHSGLKVLIMLDGFDEIQCKRLPMYLENHSGVLLPYDIIITTRTYKEVSISYLHVLVWILGFHNNESIRFIDQFYQMHICEDGYAAQQQKHDTKELLLSSVSGSALNVAKIPLLLSMACESGITKGSLTALYSKYVCTHCTLSD